MRNVVIPEFRGERNIRDPGSRGEREVRGTGYRVSGSPGMTAVVLFGFAQVLSGRGRIMDTSFVWLL